MIQQGKEVDLEFVEIPQQHPALLFLDFNKPSEIISKLKAAEANRITYYIRYFNDYHMYTRKPILPPRVLEVLGKGDTDKAIKIGVEEVQGGVENRYEEYSRVSRIYQNDWTDLEEKGLWQTATEIMGQLKPIERSLVPTFYGMGGSYWDKSQTGYEEYDLPGIFGDGLIFIRTDLNSDVENDSLKRKRILVHEFVAHALTTDMRIGTPLDEDIHKCSHQPDKEWLMNEITAQIMTRLGYYKNLSDAPHQPMLPPALESTRKSFYVNPLAPMSELKLKHPGDIAGVIREISHGIRST